MVHPCANLRASMLPIARYYCLPTLPIASFCVPSCPSHGTIVWQVAHRKVPLRAKLAMQGAIACQVAQRRVPSCAMLTIARCHCVPTLPIASLCVPSCPSQGTIVWQVAHRKVPSRAKFIMSRCHHVAMLPIVWCRGRISHGAIMCLCSLGQGAIVCLCSICQGAIMCHCRLKLSITRGTPRVPREVIP